MSGMLTGKGQTGLHTSYFHKLECIENQEKFLSDWNAKSAERAGI